MDSFASKTVLADKIKELEEANQRLAEKVAHYEQNEQRWRYLLENSRDGYFEVNLKGDFVFVNDAVCEALGYSREELLGKNNREYTTPEMARRMYEVFSRVHATGEPAEITDYEVIRKDGETRFLELYAYLLRDSGGKSVGFGGVGRDITSRKRIERDLRESQERFRRLQEATFGGICIHEQGRIVDCNTELCRLSGYEYEELIGMDGRHLFARECQEILNSHLFSDKEAQYDIVGIRADGTRLPLEIRSKALPYSGRSLRVAELRDITERKKTEEALRKSRIRYRELYREAHQAEELYQSLLDSSPDAIIFLSSDRTVQYINPAFTRLFGWTEEMLRENPVPYVPRPQRQAFFDMLESLMQSGEPVHGKEGQALTREGRFLDVSISAARQLDYKGYPAGVILIFRDITEAKRYQWHMHHAQKMESIGSMTGGIAHDFNNLLMGIQGRLSLAMMNMEEASPVYKHLKEMEAYTTRAADLTHQLLSFARREKFEVKPTDINKLVHRQTGMFGRTFKGVVLHEDLADDLLPAAVDARQIDQVLLNILVNAAHAMPDGGTIHVQTANEMLPAEQTQPHDLEAGSYVRISVSDEGMGMDAAVQRRVFEPFYTTKPRGQGTGLGLASAYNIIKNHAGFITLYSEKGKGSTFHLFLPAACEQAEAEPSAPQEVMVGGEGGILLVDDEEMIVEVASEMLRSLGYRVISAGKGTEALERLSESPDDVDLVILDLVMPEMSGRELFDRIRRVKPGIKVLLASGYSLDGQASGLLERGCSGFIQKPFKLGELSRKINEILNRED
jgi:PAS domain S-box-containing protein